MLIPPDSSSFVPDLLPQRDELIALLEAGALECTGSGAGFGAADATFLSADEQITVTATLTPGTIEIHVTCGSDDDDRTLIGHGTFLTPKEAADFVARVLPPNAGTS